MFGWVFIIFTIFRTLFGPFFERFPLSNAQKAQNFSRAARANFGRGVFIIYKIWPNVLRGVFSYGGGFNINTPVYTSEALQHLRDPANTLKSIFFICTSSCHAFELSVAGRPSWCSPGKSIVEFGELLPDKHFATDC